MSRPVSRLAAFLDARFHLEARGVTAGREVVAGLTAFLAAAYLIVVIPSLLASGGMDRGAATTAAILVCAGGSVAMGFYTNLPFIVGPGIGGSAILGVTLAQTEHIAWPIGLGIAFGAGLLFLVLTLTGAREVVVRMMPLRIKRALSASIGLFIAMLGCRDAGLVAVNASTNALKLGDFSRPGVIVALVGLAVAIALQARRVPGALLAAIAVAAAIGVPLGVTKPAGFVSLPQALTPVAFHLDPVSALSLAALPYAFAFFAGEFFSTLGTTLAVGTKARLTDAQGNLPGIERPFLIDSIVATLGPLIGIPAGTALVESAAGVEAGGRTGLTPVVAGGFFLLTLFLLPLAMTIPKQATAAALILIGISMLATNWQTVGESVVDAFPATVMVLLTLISNSFGTGIAGGVLAHVLTELVAGRLRQVPIGLIILSLPLGYYFYTVATRH